MGRERFTLHDEFVAALYDRRFYSKDLPKHFKDVYRCGHIIDGLYQANAQGEPYAKAALTELKGLIETKQAILAAVSDSVHHAFEEKQDSLAINPESSPRIIPYQWANKMYLALVEMLLVLDRSSIQLATLKLNGMLENKAFRFKQKELANPVRSVLEEVFRIEKKHKIK